MQTNSLPGFIDTEIFIQLMIPLLKELWEPGMDLLNNVRIEIEELGTNIISEIYNKFSSI